MVHGLQAVAGGDGGEECSVGAKKSDDRSCRACFSAFRRGFPGLIAVALPTPRTTIVIHNDNGVIYHEITVVPPAVEAGTGVVPAKTGTDGKPMMNANGHAVLDYSLATPNVLLELLPTGLLGLGVTALLACLMGGVAASVTSFSTVFTCDIIQTLIARNAADKRLLSVARWAAVGGVLLAFGVACATVRFNNMLEAFMLVFAS